MGVQQELEISGPSGNRPGESLSWRRKALCASAVGLTAVLAVASLCGCSGDTAQGDSVWCADGLPGVEVVDSQDSAPEDQRYKVPPDAGCITQVYSPTYYPGIGYSMETSTETPRGDRFLQGGDAFRIICWLDGTSDKLLILTELPYPQGGLSRTGEVKLSPTAVADLATLVLELCSTVDNPLKLGSGGGGAGD